MLPTKVIFLDFDGVVSTNDYKWHLNPVKVLSVTELCKNTGARIIVSSSWKVGCSDTEHFKDWLKRCFLTKEIRENCPDLFNTFIDYIAGITDVGVGERGMEIRDYLKRHDEIVNYVILDDDSDMLEEQLFNFVQTDTFEGITEREVKLCTVILNGEQVLNPIRLNLVLTTAWRNRCGEYTSEGKKIDIDTMLMKYRNREL